MTTASIFKFRPKNTKEKMRWKSLTRWAWQACCASIWCPMSEVTCWPSRIGPGHRRLPGLRGGVSTRRADDPVHSKGIDEMAKSFDVGRMAFLRGLVARGRSGVARVIFNDHPDLK